MMISRMSIPVFFLAALLAGCADTGTSLGGTRYGETGSTAQSDRNGTVASIETVKVDKNYKLGVGTAAGAVAGGILGSAIGDTTSGVVAGAVLGGLAGTYAESKMGDKVDAQRVTVNMSTGGTVTILQPVDSRLKNGTAVRVEGSGENARVVPR